MGPFITPMEFVDNVQQSIAKATVNIRIAGSNYFQVRSARRTATICPTWYAA